MDKREQMEIVGAVREIRAGVFSNVAVADFCQMVFTKLFLGSCQDRLDRPNSAGFSA